MKNIFFLLVCLWVQNCTAPKVAISPKVTQVTAEAVLFEDGTQQAFPPKGWENATTFVLVRHAEKEDAGNDPQLTPKGKERATQMAQILKNAELHKVYATPTQRTIQTAMPTFQGLGIEHGAFRHDRTKEFLNTLLERQAGKRFLIVGHSNTTPAMVNYLLDNIVYEDIPHDVYNKMYLVACKNVGQTKVLELEF